MHAASPEIFVRLDTAVVAALPPLSDLERMSFDAILAECASTVMRVAGALGVQLTDAEVEVLLERLVGVRELPPFRREDYDLYC